MAQYTRLKRKLEDTKNEIAKLTEIEEQFNKYTVIKDQTLQYQYNLDKFEIESIERKLKVLLDKQTEYAKDIALLENSVLTLTNQLKELRKQRIRLLYLLRTAVMTIWRGN